MDLCTECGLSDSCECRKKDSGFCACFKPRKLNQAHRHGVGEIDLENDAVLPLIHTDQTKPLPAHQSKSRVVSIGASHMVKLLALSKAQAGYITKEDMCRKLIDDATADFQKWQHRQVIQAATNTARRRITEVPTPSPKADTCEASAKGESESISSKT